MGFIKKYWKEIIFFIVIAAIYISLTTPAPSWFGLGSDLWDWMYSTKFMTVSHFPSYPGYVLPGMLITHFTNSVDGQAWALSFWLSTIPAVLSFIMVYIAVKAQALSEWAPWVASAALAGSMLFVSQSIIPETYVLSAFVGISVYTFLMLARKYNSNNLYNVTAVFLAWGIGLHPFAWGALLAMIIFDKKLRSKWRIYLFGILPYAYMFILPGNKWNASLFTGTGIQGYVQYILGTIQDNMQYWGGIAVWKVPQRTWQLLILLLTSFGLAVIPMALYFIKEKRRTLLIIGCIFVPVMYYWLCSVEVSYRHFLLAFPYLAVAAGLGIDQLIKENKNTAKITEENE